MGARPGAGLRQLIRRLAVGMLVLALAGCTAASPAPRAGSRQTLPPSSVPPPSAPAPLRILAVGDSYTVGTGIDQGDAWPAQLADRLNAAGVAAEVEVVARAGWTSHAAARALAGPDPAAPYDVVIAGVGVNDHFYEFGLATFEEGLGALFPELVEAAGGVNGRVLVLTIPDWSVTPRASELRRTPEELDVGPANGVLGRTADAAGFRVVDVTAITRRAATEPELLATDGLHGSAAMYAEWAELLVGEVTAAVGD